MTFTIDYNARKNRIEVITNGITEENVNDYNEQFAEIMELVKPGFTGITDVRTSKSVLSPEVAALLAPTGEMVTVAGVAGWVYIADAPVWIMQMKRLFGKFAVHFKTREEAIAYLDSLTINTIYN